MNIYCMFLLSIKTNSIKKTTKGCDLLESFLKVKAGSEQMKNSTKGMLLSGLIYPGLGQLIFGYVFSGIILILLATTGFIILLYRIMQRTWRVIDQILPLLAEKKLTCIP